MPGLSLFSELLKKLPKPSLKAVLSFLTLVFLVLGWLHYREYDAFQAKMKLPRQLLQQAQQLLLSSGKSELTPLQKAEEKLDEALLAWGKTKVPPRNFWILPLLPKHLKTRRLAFQEMSQAMRTQQLLPKLLRARMIQHLEEERLMRRLGAFPEVIVSKVKVQQKKFKVLKKRPIQRQHPLSFYRGARYQALRSSNVMLLRVMTHKRMLQVLKGGHLAFVLDLRQRTGFEEQLFGQARRRLGYTGKRKELFQRRGIREELRHGRASFIFQNLDTAGKYPAQPVADGGVLAQISALPCVFDDLSTKHCAVACPACEAFSPTPDSILYLSKGPSVLAKADIDVFF